MLRPIDMTLTIQGSAEAHRMGAQGAQSARPEVAGAMFAERLEKQVREQEQKVNESNQAEKNEVNPDRDGNAKGYNPQRKQKKPEPPKKSDTAKRLTGESLYDIRI